MLLHPPQPSSSSAIAHYNLLPAPYSSRATPRSLAAVDRLPQPPQHPNLRADQPRHPDSPLEHSHNYHYVPRPQPAHSSPSPDAMYQQHPHVQPHLYDTHHQHLQNAHPNHPPNAMANPQQDFDQPRQQPPSIHTDNLVYPSDSGNYSPSPASSPSDHAMAAQSSSRPFSFPQPMSAPHSQNAFPPRYENDPSLPRFAFPNQTLDRRMSEPVLGAGRQAYPQPPPPHHDTFAYSGASSATTIQPSPLSPRPSSSYSSYGSYPGHERDNSGASLGSAGIQDAYAPSGAPTWGSGIKHSDLEQDAALASSPLSPLYAASAASGSDASGLPSPPLQSRPSPSQRPGQLSGRNLPSSPTSSNTPRAPGNSKTYSFVSLPGNAVKKRPRRRYDEIERLYQCSWPGCQKAYGTLNHLNAHVTMQRHGQKRSPNEFKELRKQWRQQKKEQEEQERELEREQAHVNAMAMQHEMQQYAHHPQMSEFEHHRHVRRRLSMAEPYPHPHAHAHPHPLPGHSYLHGGLQGHGPGPGQVHGGFGGAPPFNALQGPGMSMEARYGLPTPADDMAQFRYPPPPPSQVTHTQGLPSINLTHHNAGGPEDDIYFRNPANASQPIPLAPHGESVGPAWGTPHTPVHHHPHALRASQSFYSAQGASSSITLPPPHSLGGISASAPNPSPLSGSAFPSLGPSTGHPTSLSGQPDVNLGLPGPGGESGSPTPELAAHVSLGSNRLPPDSTLLTPLPGYEPDLDRDEVEHGRDRDQREYARDPRDERDSDWQQRGRERERYYAEAAQGNGRDQYE